MLETKFTPEIFQLLLPNAAAENRTHDSTIVPSRGARGRGCRTVGRSPTCQNENWHHGDFPKKMDALL